VLARQPRTAVRSDRTGASWTVPAPRESSKFDRSEGLFEASHKADLARCADPATRFSTHAWREQRHWTRTSPRRRSGTSPVTDRGSRLRSLVSVTEASQVRVALGSRPWQYDEAVIPHRRSRPAAELRTALNSTIHPLSRFAGEGAGRTRVDGTRFQVDAHSAPRHELPARVRPIVLSIRPRPTSGFPAITRRR
jgi:hypothetical protein